MSKTIKFISVTVLFFTLLYSQNYLWPTNSSTQLSATFGEYRSGHFHAGIDIKTNNKTGYPCYAVEDGYISRVLTKPYGYGKAVYLQLNDGNTAVYGHLEGFAGKVDSVVKAEQKRLGHYSINKYLKKSEIPVKKGDIICYTGVTGTQHPHLHFELRDKNHNPIDPLQFDGLSVIDETPPKISKIAIVPIAGKTLINNSPENGIFKPVYLKNGEYKIQKPIVVSDAFAIEISTHDVVKGLWNKYGNAKIELFIDEFSYFTQVADKFSYNNNGLIVIDRDFQLMAEGEGRFIRMWKYDENANMPFHKTRSDGIIRPKNDKFTARIDVYDFNGNKSSVSMTFLRESIKPPKILEFSTDSTNFNFVMKRDTLEHLYASLNLEWVTATGKNISRAEMLNFAKTDSTYTFSTNRNNSNILKIIGVSNITDRKLIAYVNPSADNSENNVKLKHIHNAKTFVTKVKFQRPPKMNPEMYLQSAKYFLSVPLLAISPVEYISADNSLKKWYKAHTIEIRNHNEVVYRQACDQQMILPKSKGDIKAETFDMKFKKNLVYDTLMVSTAIDTNFSNGNFELLSDVYKIYPWNQLLKNGAELTIKYDDTLENLDNVGIYSVNSKRISYAGGKIDTINKTITARISGFGKYALARDDTPPTIKNIYPQNGKYYKSSSVTRLKASIDDKLSRIAGEKAIIMKLDGEKVIAEWHPLHKTLKFFPENRLAKGEHQLYISVTDKMGNCAEKTVTFHILD